MIHLATFSWIFMGNVGKHSIHGFYANCYSEFDGWLHNLSSFQGCIRQLHLNRLTLEKKALGCFETQPGSKCFETQQEQTSVILEFQLFNKSSSINSLCLLLLAFWFLSPPWYPLFHNFIALIIAAQASKLWNPQIPQQRKHNKQWLTFIQKGEPPSYQWSYNFNNPLWAYG